MIPAQFYNAGGGGTEYIVASSLSEVFDLDTMTFLKTCDIFYSTTPGLYNSLYHVHCEKGLSIGWAGYDDPVFRVRGTDCALSGRSDGASYYLMFEFMEYMENTGGYTTLDNYTDLKSTLNTASGFHIRYIDD